MFQNAFLAFFVKQGKIYKSTFISVYHSFAYLISFTATMCGEQLHLLPWKIIPNSVLIITCSLGRVHMELLYFANSVLNVSDISDNIVAISTYECLYDNSPDIFRNSFQRKVDVHDHNLRKANNLYMRLDIRKFGIKIAGANLRNYLPSFVKNSQSIPILRKNARPYLTERKGYF